MSMNQRTPRHDEVDIGVPVLILDPGTSTPMNKRRFASHRAEGADWAIDAAWEE
jgi:hypothetical protein